MHNAKLGETSIRTELLQVSFCSLGPKPDLRLSNAKTSGNGAQFIGALRKRWQGLNGRNIRQALLSKWWQYAARVFRGLQPRLGFRGAALSVASLSCACLVPLNFWVAVKKGVA